MAYAFQKIAKNLPADKINPEDAKSWFRQAAQEMKTVNPSKMLSTAGKGNLQSSIEIDDIGKMFMFYYDPKLKDVLPFYDTFPLCLPIELYSDGFLGLNMHYLPPVARAQLFDALYATMNNNKYDRTTRLKLRYKLLKGASRFSGFEPCVKRYLFSHVRSSFLYVDPENWDMALMLPTERFKGARKQTVWSQS